MADKAAQQKDVETTVEVEKDKPKVENDRAKAKEVAPAEEESKSENGADAENGEEVEQENGKDEDDEKNNGKGEEEEKVCSVKRKSGGGDAPDGTPAEGATPEKKAKLNEAAENDSKKKSEVAA